MVRGHPKCPSLCGICKKDCKCLSCGRCHTCKGCYCNNCGDYQWNSGYRQQKNQTQHSCSQYDIEGGEHEKEKLELKKRIGELEAQILKTSADRLSLRRFTRYFGSDTVSFLIGSEHKAFTAYVDIICSVSTYLKDILLAEVSGDKPKTIVLDDDEVHNVHAFEMFLDYCHWGTYFGTEDKTDDTFLLHARVYVLAEKFQCLELKSLALKKATDWCYGHSIQPGEDKFHDIFPDILDAVRIVYSYTTDSESGSLPSPGLQGSSKKIIRDRFRLLLAHLAAVHLTNLQAISSFVEIHNAFPDFSTDMLLFIKERPGATGTETTENNSISLEPNTLEKEKVIAFSRFFHADIFTVIVGEDAKRFNVHTAAIECSEYFQNLMTSDMIEAREKTVHLNSEVDSAEAFEKFVQYCYFQEYSCSEDRADNLMQHARVYVLAERLRCFGLKDLALQKANAVCNATSSDDPDEILLVISTVVAMIYENTYDKYSGKVLEVSEESKEDAAGESSGYEANWRKRLKKNNPERENEVAGDETAAVNDKYAKRDGFRVLLARFASVYLPILRMLGSFVTTHHAFPDFATDVMLLATAGEKMQLDEDGQLKLPARALSFGVPQCKVL